MNYQSCLDYMARYCKRGQPGGWQRTKRMAELLGNPQETLCTIHIAGTNGKGSTAAILEEALRQAGYRTGLFTSPHLERYEERIQRNRVPITEEAFAAGMTMLIEEIVPQIEAEQLGHPGEFELLTVLSWMSFAGTTDIVLSEVGLGGRLDPTNLILHPMLTIITPISRDHCQILGDTVGAIAKEKAGILKQGVPLVLAPQTAEAEAVILEEANKKQVPVTVLRMETMENVESRLQGNYQQINCNTAITALRVLQEQKQIVISEEQIQRALQQVQWPGRMEYWSLGEKKGILMDGAHNIAGVEALKEALDNIYAGRKVHFFLSILDDKEQWAMLRRLLPEAERVLVTKPEGEERAQHWEVLVQKIHEIRKDCPCESYASYEEGLRAILPTLQQGDLLCITGSLHLLGNCRRILPAVLKELFPA